MKPRYRLWMVEFRLTASDHPEFQCCESEPEAVELVHQLRKVPGVRFARFWELTGEG